MTTALNNALYHQIKTLIGFWCRRKLNPRSLIQPSEILSIELTETHIYLLKRKEKKHLLKCNNCYFLKQIFIFGEWRVLLLHIVIQYVLLYESEIAKIMSILISYNLRYLCSI